MSQEGLYEAATRYLPECDTLISAGTRYAKELEILSPHVERIVALEPDPKARTELKKAGYDVLPYALWDSNCKGWLQVSPYCPSMMSRGGRTVKVHCRTLDWLDNSVHLGDRIFLWLDIEGSELRALNGARNLLGNGRISYVYVELWPLECVRSEHWAVDTQVVEVLTVNGFSLVYESETLHKGHRDAIFRYEQQ